MPLKTLYLQNEVMVRNLKPLLERTRSVLTQKSFAQRLNPSSKQVKKYHQPLAWLSWTAIVSTTAFMLIPTLTAFARNFETRFSLQARGRTTIFGNAVTSCSTTTNPNSNSCTTARSATTGSYVNNDYYMDYVDIDGDSSTFNSSSATYTFPTSNAGFDIVWAGLYWAGDTSGAPAAINANDKNKMLLKVPGTSTYQTITAEVIDTIGNRYSAYANVTSLVKQGKSGTYFGANIQTGKGTDRYGGWALIVVYTDKTEILRSMTIFDGFLGVSSGAPITTTISGFLTPTAGPFEAAIGSFSSEGDVGYTGDQFLLDGDGANSDGDGVDQPFKVVSDINNPSTNFFNSSNSLYGTRISTNTSVTAPGGKTLGPISRNPDYPNLLALDMDIVEAKDTGGNAIMQNKATQAGLQFTSNGDVYYPTAFFFSVEVFQPVLTQNFTKTVTDINGGDALPGDILEYTISYNNTGNDTATDVILTDAIPAKTTYEPNSLVFTTDPDPSLTTPTPMSDAMGDDRAEFDSANNRVVFRSGIGATALNGGKVPFDNPATPVQEADTVRVKFRVKINSPLSTSPTIISNQAAITYKGEFSGTSFSGVSDDPGTVNQPSDPTNINVVNLKPPNLLLVKRITRVNNQTMNGSLNLNAYVNSSSPYDDNVDETPPFSGQPDPNKDDTSYWPDFDSNASPDDFLKGQIDAGKAIPNDEIEYTIYFLSTGGKNANDVKLCDRVPAHQTFVPNAFNITPPAPGGLPTSDRGIIVNLGGTVQAYTNDDDGDIVRYFPPNSDPTTVYPTLNCGGANTNGAVVVNLGTLPSATAPGTPANSYGYIRFRATVN